MLWCRHLPTVDVPRGTPKHITLVIPYYENPSFLQTQAERWRAYPPELAQWLSIIVVDDGSPTPCEALADLPLPFRLFRVDVDVRWNWLAARNIGAFHAEDGWIVLTDMDHVLPTETLRAIVLGVHDPAVMYAFSRREHTGETINPHSASFLMTRKLFWTIGGYDETLSGHYGTDGEYRGRASNFASMRLLPDVLERHEYVGDSSTQRYLRKQPEDAAVRKLIAARPRNWRPRVLSFPYHEVAA